MDPIRRFDPPEGVALTFQAQAHVEAAAAAAEQGEIYRNDAALFTVTGRWMAIPAGLFISILLPDGRELAHSRHGAVHEATEPCSASG